MRDGRTPEAACVALTPSVRTKHRRGLYVHAYTRSDVRVATPEPRLFGTTVSRSWVEVVEIKSEIFPLEGGPTRAERVLLD